MTKIKVLTILTGFVLLVACTEIYTPKIDSGTEALVVEGLITNESGPFIIKLSKANLYNSTDPVSYVEGAKLTVYDNHNQNFTFTGGSNGLYYLQSDFKAQTGDSYSLHIETVDGDIYDSKPQKLLPPQSYDSIYGVHTANSYIGTDNQLKSVVGSNIQVNMFKSVAKADSAPLCRFKSTMTLQYEYWEDINSDSAWVWIHKCWNSITLGENENITENNANKNSANITGHLVCFAPIGMTNYGLAKPLGFVTDLYYLRIDQYTINQDTYDFYKNANKQLSTSGKIFDPITSQLVGNLKCTNNSSKIVLGFFEVSSVTRSAILIYHAANSSIVSLYQVPYIGISNGQVQYKQMKPPGQTPKKDPDFINTTPSWWTHF